MTERTRRLWDLYTDYLLVSFGATTATGLTATGLSRWVPEVSHDQVTRLLSQQKLTDKDLWKIVKPHVRAVESPPLNRPMRFSSLTTRWKRSLTVTKANSSPVIMTTAWAAPSKVSTCSKGVNLLSALYYSQGVSLPLCFELIQKTALVSDPKTGKDKWVSPKTKNEMACEMVASVKVRQIAFSYVLADVWLMCGFLRARAST